MTNFASDMNWKEIEYFSPNEWPGNCLNFMDRDVIHTLDIVRETCGHPMTPSPVYEGHVRHDYTGSRHSTQLGNRASDATDIFMRWNTIYDGWLACLEEPIIGGLGLYTDTHWGNDSRPMLHIDIRPGKRVLWVRSEGEYIYYHNDPVRFFKCIIL